MWTPKGNRPTFTAASGFSGSNIEKVKIVGSFLANGGSNPVAASNRGDPFSVLRTSAGLFTVTLGAATALLGQYGVKQILSIQATLGKGAAGNALRIVVGTVVDAAGTFQLRLEDAAGAATDLAAAADNRVFFEVVFSNGAL